VLRKKYILGQILGLHNSAYSVLGWTVFMYFIILLPTTNVHKSSCTVIQNSSKFAEGGRIVASFTTSETLFVLSTI